MEKTDFKKELKHLYQPSAVGKHHEIYLSDIRKADPKRWKTVIRQPMQ